MDWMLDRVGRAIARYLQKPARGYEPFTPSDPAALQASLQRGDVLLIEAFSFLVASLSCRIAWFSLSSLSSRAATSSRVAARAFWKASRPRKTPIAPMAIFRITTPH
jgi:hypothetical protein